MALKTAQQNGETARATDLELALRAAGGDTAAFEAIMRRHNRALYRTARSITRNDAEAEEVVQEGYLRAYQGLGSFRAESNFGTWLTRIVINQALERLRQRKREVDTVASDNVINLEAHIDMAYKERHSVETPERMEMREQTRKLLEQKIDELPAAFCTVFVLRAIEEMSVEETAACLGIAEVTVRTRFFRARRLLRKSLKADISGALEEAFAFGGERCDRIVSAVLASITSPA